MSLAQWYNPASWFSSSEEQEIADLVEKFPAALAKAKRDWAKFKVGVKAGVFSREQYDDALAWFVNFPKLWETIRPNFDPVEAGYMGRSVSEFRRGVLKEADAFVAKLRGTPEFKNLGFVVTATIVAGILIAGIFGAAGAIWAVGYLKKQNNVSNMIDEVTAGRLPPEVLKKAVAEDSGGGGFFDNIADMVKYGVVAGVLVLGWPLLKKVTGARA